MGVTFKATKGASTPCQWCICLQHTRSGSGAQKIRGKTPQARTDYKKDIVSLVLERSVADASTLGIVMGDLNLDACQIRDVIWSNELGKAFQVVGSLGGASLLLSVLRLAAPVVSGAAKMPLPCLCRNLAQ